MNQQMREPLYEVSQEFKTMAIEILEKKKFTDVYQMINFLKSEDTVYPESSLNTIVQTIGEYAYFEVSHFFEAMNSMVKPASFSEQPANEEAPAEA
jgi:hypothetical protein